MIATIDRAIQRVTIFAMMGIWLVVVFACFSAIAVVVLP